MLPFAANGRLRKGSGRRSDERAREGNLLALALRLALLLLLALLASFAALATLAAAGAALVLLTLAAAAALILLTLTAALTAALVLLTLAAAHAALSALAALAALLALIVVSHLFAPFLGNTRRGGRDDCNAGFVSAFRHQLFLALGSATKSLAMKETKATDFGAMALPPSNCVIWVSISASRPRRAEPRETNAVWQRGVEGD
jgi:hypothetical protein